MTVTSSELTTQTTLFEVACQLFCLLRLVFLMYYGILPCLLFYCVVTLHSYIHIQMKSQREQNMANSVHSIFAHPLEHCMVQE